jgi:hypothetical protein
LASELTNEVILRPAKQTTLLEEAGIPQDLVAFVDELAAVITSDMLEKPTAAVITSDMLEKPTVLWVLFVLWWMGYRLV